MNLGKLKCWFGIHDWGDVTLARKGRVETRTVCENGYREHQTRQHTIYTRKCKHCGEVEVVFAGYLYPDGGLTC